MLLYHHHCDPHYVHPLADSVLALAHTDTCIPLSVGDLCTAAPVFILVGLKITYGQNAESRLRNGLNEAHYGMFWFRMPERNELARKFHIVALSWLKEKKKITTKSFQKEPVATQNRTRGR